MTRDELKEELMKCYIRDIRNAMSLIDKYVEEQWESYRKKLEDRIEKLEAVLKKAKEALQFLYDEQNGAPLLIYEKEWKEAMAQTEQVLNEIKEGVK